MNTTAITRTITSDWGIPLERLVREFAGFCALIYTAGLLAGEWIHRTNDQLSQAWVAMLGVSTPAEPEPEVTEPAPVQAALTAADHAITLEALTVRELRRLAIARGLDRKLYRTARKAELVLALAVDTIERG